MNWTKNKTYFSLILCLSVTAIVTACVKNGSKNEPLPITKSLDLSSQELSQDEINGSDYVSLKEKLDASIEELTKEYRFSISEIMDMQVRPGSVSNDQCSSQEDFTYSFTLVDAQGVELDMVDRKETLVPGSYRLVLKMENGGLCRDLNMRFSLETKVRDDLILTENIDMAYICEGVVENGKELRRRYVRVQSNPLSLAKFNRFNDQKTEDVVSETAFCAKPLPSNTRCVIKNVPAVTEEGPEVAKQVRCGYSQKNRPNANIYLQMDNLSGTRDAQFSCSNQDSLKTMRLSNCRLLSRFNRPLPIEHQSSEIQIDRGVVRMDYKLSEDIALPARPKLYVMIYARDENGYELPLLNKYHEVTPDEIREGQFEIRERGIRRALADQSPRQLKMVFSRRAHDLSNPNQVKRGFRYMDLGELCGLNQDGISIKRRGGAVENYCE